MSYWAEGIQCQVDGNLLIGCFYVSITNSKPDVGNASYSRWIYFYITNGRLWSQVCILINKWWSYIWSRFFKCNTGANKYRFIFFKMKSFNYILKCFLFFDFRWSNIWNSRSSKRNTGPSWRQCRSFYTLLSNVEQHCGFQLPLLE